MSTQSVEQPDPSADDLQPELDSDAAQRQADEAQTGDQAQPDDETADGNEADGDGVDGALD